MRFELGKLELFGVDLGSLWQRWWQGINSLTPVPLADVFLSPAPKIRVVLEAEQLLLEQVLPTGQLRELMRLGYPEFDLLEDHSLYEQLTAGVNKKLLQLELVLPESQVLRRKVVVPAVARSNLRQVLGFQISKLTPFAREQVFYDVRECSAIPGSGMLEVELLVVSSVFVEKWQAKVRQVTGLPVARVQAPTPVGEVNSSNFLGRLGVPSRWGKRLNRNSGLTLLLLLCISLVMVAPVAKLRWDVAQGKREIAALNQRVADTRHGWYGLQENVGNLEYMLNQHGEHGHPAVILDELTRLIPDGIFLTSMTLDKNRVEITGQGSGVVDLVEVLNASEFFEQAKFSSAITRGRDNLDIFSISMQLAKAEVQQ